MPGKFFTYYDQNDNVCCLIFYGGLKNNLNDVETKDLYANCGYEQISTCCISFLFMLAKNILYAYIMHFQYSKGYCKLNLIIHINQNY